MNTTSRLCTQGPRALSELSLPLVMPSAPPSQTCGDGDIQRGKVVCRWQWCWEERPVVVCALSGCTWRGVCTVTWTKQFPKTWGGPSWSGEFSHLCEHWGDVFIVHACLVTSVLSDPMDYSSPGSSVHGILQARILELFAMPSSRGSSQPRNHTRAPVLAGRFFTTSATWEAPCLE